MFNQSYLLTFIIGVILAYQYSRMPGWAEVICLIIFSTVFVRSFRFILPAGLGFLAVFLAASYHQSKHLALELWQVPQEIQIIVEGHTPLNSHVQQYQVYNDLFNQSFTLSHYVRTQELQVGDCYLVTAKLKPRRALGNPNTAHFAKNQWASREFIHGYIDAKKAIAPVSCPKKWLPIDEWRDDIKKTINSADISETAKTMITALVIGERKGLTDEHWDILQKTGTAHLLAISGLHIGLVYAITLWLGQLLLRPLGLLWLRVNMLVVASGFALAVSGFYVLISGSGISSLRAWGMLCVITLLLIRREQLQALQVLLLVVAFILVTDPLAGMGMGLWLSAGAVFALIWLKANAWHVHWKLPVMMLPMTSVWLKSAWVGPIANGIAIPMVSLLVVPGALLGVCLSILQAPCADWVMFAVGGLLDALWFVLTWLSQYAVMHQWSLLTLTDKMIFTGLICCLLLPWRFVGVIPFIILMAALSWPKLVRPEPGTVILHVIDAGQGTALLVQTRNKNLLFDVGSPIVVDYLRHYRVNHLDVVVVSHNDNDHRAGFADLVKEFSIQTIYSGEVLSEVPNDAQQRCRAGQAWDWEGVRFQFISPLHGKHRGNNASCVLKITLGEQSLLFTGDIEHKVEEELVALNDPELLKASVLIAPHHGSKTSSTYAFLEAVSPEVVIYPTGFLNSYHHPHPDIVARSTHLGVKQFNTAQDGALRVKLSKHRIDAINCYRKDHRRWWAMNEEATCSGYLAQAGH